MKDYELTVLIHPDLETSQDTALSKVKKLIKDSGGEVVREDNWGKRHLAYAIKGQVFAVYVFFELKLPAEAPLKISNTLNITDEVIRYLLVKKDEKLNKVDSSEESEDNNKEEE
jgi:small subunit ribosomal protein S6